MPDKASPALVQRRNRMLVFLDELKRKDGMTPEGAYRFLLNMGLTLQKVKIYLKELRIIGAVKFKDGRFTCSDGKKFKGMREN